MSGYVLEILVGEEAVALPPTYDDTAVEISIEEISTVKNVPGSVAVEVGGPVQAPFQVGGVDPTDNPAVLVWFDTQGA